MAFLYVLFFAFTTAFVMFLIKWIVDLCKGNTDKMLISSIAMITLALFINIVNAIIKWV
ncbi:hypothetical protein [Virgibacillus salexigens]|uniref:Uncharacterized protein n=1 Tax=Virgibacillus kapii TaxID=1638645 RepID=A0ABQ2D8Y2_9BACI|nr:MULTISPECIES: hypothetical protein [Virgibacillus]GGJ48609.1 hypothetical protein GCM10007111_08420 [Virgibacillus kapii]